MARIPVIADVDLLVLGDSTGAVSCARAAARAGGRVFLAGGRSYLGTDICAHWRYWPEEPDAATDLSRQLFAEASPRPLRVKRLLEQSLVGAGVPFLFGSYPAGALTGPDGRLAGVVLANRAGLQAVRARSVVDATWRAVLARQAGVDFSPWPAGAQTVERVVVGGEALADAARRLGTVTHGETAYPVWAYSESVAMADGSWSSFAAAETDLRRRLWHPEQVFGGERLFLLPPDPVAPGEAHVKAWPGADALPLEALAAGAGLHLLGPAADLSRAAAGTLCNPHHLMALGERLGVALAEATGPAAGEPLAWTLAGAEPCGAGRTSVLADGPRGHGPAETALEIDLESLPLLGEAEVVVAGGGTAGAPAGIGAARAGARTLVLEYQAGLGGVGTMGLITRYYHGNRVGFTGEMDREIAALQGEEAPRDWNIECKQAWYLEALAAAGAEVWFEAATVGARVEGERLCGVLAAGPHGFGWLRAGAVVDATGNADVAAAAGAPCRRAGEEEIAVQGTGLSPRNPGVQYQNSDHSFSEDGDVVDATSFFVSSKVKFQGHFDLAQIVDSRERRQIVGDLTLAPVDFLAERQYPDAICLAQSNFDSHGFTVHPLFMAKAPDKRELSAYVPYRCLLPRGLDGVLATGLSVSAQRDSLPVIRMQPDVQNQGYAAGRAAAMAQAAGVPLREVDLAALQEHLVAIGILPPAARGAADSFPLPEETVRRAVAEEWDTHRGLAIIFGAAERALPLLRQAWDAAAAEAPRLRYAKVLGLLGDAHGAETLVAHLQATGWDAGWNYRGMGQFGMSLSEVDTSLVALARCGDARTMECIEALAAALGAEPELSHCRALALAAEAVPGARGGRALAGVLARPGLAGHALTSTAAFQAALTDAINENRVRNRALREILLARAVYRCGDVDGRAREILARYAGDVRGQFARHARRLLAEG